MNHTQTRQGLSTAAVVAMVIGGGMLGMFVLCCGGCLVFPAITATSRAVKDRLNIPSSARFEHPAGSSWALGDHEQIVYEPGRYGVRGKVFAKNALGVERGHSYDAIFVVTDGDFDHAEMISLKID